MIRLLKGKNAQIAIMSKLSHEAQAQMFREMSAVQRGAYFAYLMSTSDSGAAYMGQHLTT